MSQRQYTPKARARAPAPRTRAAPRAAPRPRAPVRAPAPRQAPAPYSPSIGRQLLEGGGSALGSLFGPSGAVLGRSAGNALSTIIGLGDYKINQNVFLQGRLPQMMNVPQGGGTVIRFQEYITDIISSSSADTFNIESFNINAANASSFPFLSQIAENYEQYSFEGLVYEFRSTSGDALTSSNTALGSVILCTNYDSLDANFASKGEMLNYEYSTSVKPSENCMHMIECAPRQSVLSKLYCLPGSVPTGADARLYHLGKFQIATTGFQGTSVNCGQLHCTYQVRLLKPKLYASLGLSSAAYNSAAAAGTALNATPLGTGHTIAYNTIGCTVNAGNITFPDSQIRERFLITVFMSGSAAAVVQPGITYSGCAAGGLTAISQTPASGVSSINIRYMVDVYTAGKGATPVVTFDTAGTLPTGTTGLRIYIVQIPNDMA